jgi:hypothetical protein
MEFKYLEMLHQLEQLLLFILRLKDVFNSAVRQVSR